MTKTDYDPVSEGGGRALRSRSYTTQRGRAATKKITPSLPSPLEGISANLIIDFGEGVLI